MPKLPIRLPSLHPRLDEAHNDPRHLNNTLILHHLRSASQTEISPPWMTLSDGTSDEMRKRTSLTALTGTIEIPLPRVETFRPIDVSFATEEVATTLVLRVFRSVPENRKVIKKPSSDMLASSTLVSRVYLYSTRRLDTLPRSLCPNPQTMAAAVC